MVTLFDDGDTLEVVQQSTCYIGIDPGLSGGLVSINGDRVRATKMPVSERDVFDWMIAQIGNPCVAMIEKVGGFIPGKGGEGQPGSAMFKFGQSYGSLRMALVAADIPFDEVIPQTWQKKMGIQARVAGENRGHFKARLRAKAQQLFPKVNVTLHTADAILIAEYCRRKYTGEL